jgi:hypothetical protein
MLQPGILGLKGKLGAGMAKSSLQSIGLQLGKQVLNTSPPKPAKSVKSLKMKSVSRRTSVVSTETSQVYWMWCHKLDMWYHMLLNVISHVYRIFWCVLWCHKLYLMWCHKLTSCDITCVLNILVCIVMSQALLKMIHIPSHLLTEECVYYDVTN